MLTKTIHSLSEFIDAINEFDNGQNMIYRGECELYNPPIISGIGRELKRFDKNPKLQFKFELNLFIRFKSKAISHIDLNGKSDLELLMIAQHNGLITRLIDFTQNPLVALYFAVNKNFEEPGYVYMSDDLSYFSEKYDNSQPIEVLFKSINEYTILAPPQIDPRIIVQSGILILAPNPTKPFESIDVKLKILNKEKIFSELNHLNVNLYSLFPQLDKLTQHLNYNFRKK